MFDCGFSFDTGSYGFDSMSSYDFGSSCSFDSTPSYDFGSSYSFDSTPSFDWGLNLNTTSWLDNGFGFNAFGDMNSPATTDYNLNASEIRWIDLGNQFDSQIAALDQQNLFPNEYHDARAEIENNMIQTIGLETPLNELPMAGNALDAIGGFAEWTYDIPYVGGYVGPFTTGLLSPVYDADQSLSVNQIKDQYLNNFKDNAGAYLEDHVLDPAGTYIQDKILDPFNSYFVDPVAGWFHNDVLGGAGGAATGAGAANQGSSLFGNLDFSGLDYSIKPYADVQLDDIGRIGDVLSIGSLDELKSFQGEFGLGGQLNLDLGSSHLETIYDYVNDKTEISYTNDYIPGASLYYNDSPEKWETGIKLDWTFGDMFDGASWSFNP